MKTINFCGDSFCKGYGRMYSYTDVLAGLLDAKIIGRGKEGTARERVFETFDPTADYTVICWTEPFRLYHPEYSITMRTCDKLKDKNKAYQAGYDYFKYLHNANYMERVEQREFYWFDNEVLSKYEGKCMHIFSFYKSYTFKHGINFERILKPLTNYNDEYANHMDKETNIALAKILHKRFKNA